MGMAMEEDEDGDEDKDEDEDEDDWRHEPVYEYEWVSGVQCILHCEW